MSRFKNVINFFKSLKFRLILFLILFGIVPGIVLKVGIVKTYEDRSVSIKTSEILSQAKILANQAGIFFRTLSSKIHIKIQLPISVRTP